MLREFAAKCLSLAKRKSVTNALFCCAPAIIFLCTLAFLKLDPFLWVPLWSDEVGWYSQIDAAARYGAPLGYPGCNETHAAFGTFGFWGGAAIYVMAAFAKLFGWHYWSPLFLNVFYLTFANVAFLALVRPGALAALRLAALDCVLFVNTMYIFTGMSECTRFSMAIILAALFIYLLNDENRARKAYRCVLYVIAPVCLFFFVNCYIMFAFLFPVYGYAVIKNLGHSKNRVLLYAAMCGIMPIIATLAILFLLQMTSAPYPNTLQGYLNQPNVLQLLRTLWTTIADNARYAGLKFILDNVRLDYGYVSAYLLFYYIVLGATILNLIRKLMMRTARPIDFLLPYALAAFIAGFFTLYSTKSSWTYIRGLNVALVFSLYTICALDWHKTSHTLLCIAIMQFLPFVPLLRNSVGMRLQTPNRFGGGKELFDKYTTVFAEHMPVSHSANPWENTYAMYGKIFNFYAAMPTGITPNTIMSRQPVTKPKYAVMDKETKVQLDGYVKTYSDELIDIYEKEAEESEATK